MHKNAFFKLKPWWGTSCQHSTDLKLCILYFYIKFQIGGILYRRNHKYICILFCKNYDIENKSFIKRKNSGKFRKGYN